MQHRSGAGGWKRFAPVFAPALAGKWDRAVRDARDHWRSASCRAMVRFRHPERPRRVPGQVQIEPTSRCNLRCKTCPHSAESARGGGRHLAPAELEMVLARLPFSPGSVTLSGIGEPLLNPDFPELVDILADRGIDCRFYTNGTLLTERNRAALLARRNISRISISCDSADRRTFESLRVGASFGAWQYHVRSFVTQVSAARNRGVPQPALSMFTVLNGHGADGARDTIRFARDLGFGSIVLFEPIRPAGRPAAPAAVDRAQLGRFGRSVGIGVEICARRAATPPHSAVRCTQPWDYVFIRATGDVAPCRVLADPDEAPVMGNLFERPFMQIWHGDRFRAFRKASALGTNPLCARCPYY